MKTSKRPDCLDVRPDRLDVRGDAELEWQPPVAPFQAFPVECFPQTVREYVRAQARAVDCDESAVSLPVLAALASSIGGTRRIRLKPAWTEPAVLWTAVVADHSTRQEPALEAAVGVLSARQLRELPLMDPKILGYRRQLVEHRVSLRGWESHRAGSPPQRPTPPVTSRYLTSDWSAQSVTRLLAGRPRGMLVCCTELDGWLGRSNRGRWSAHVENWLALHGGRSLIVQGRTAQQTPLCLPHACASVTGTIHPETLSRELTNAGIKGPTTSSGLISRLLMAFPPPRPRRWTDDDVQESVTAGYGAVVEKLLALQFADQTAAGEYQDSKPDLQAPRKKKPGNRGTKVQEQHELDSPPVPPIRNMDGEFKTEAVMERYRAHARELLRDPSGWQGLRANFKGRPEEEMIEHMAGRLFLVPRTVEPDPPILHEEVEDRPALVELSPEAKSRFARFVNDFGREQADVDEALTASFVQLEAQAARLALVLHVARWAAGEKVDPSVCDIASIESGISLARWFASELRRIHAMVCETPEQHDRRTLVEWLLRRGGDASPRDLCRANGRKHPTIDRAEEALKGLVDNGLGAWVDRPSGKSGGRPFRAFVLQGGVSDEGSKTRGVMKSGSKKSGTEKRPMPAEAVDRPGPDASTDLPAPIPACPAASTPGTEKNAVPTENTGFRRTADANRRTVGVSSRVGRNGTNRIIPKRFK